MIIFATPNETGDAESSGCKVGPGADQIKNVGYQVL
jgi:hypothetical protein